MEKEYRTIPCEKKTEEMLLADKMLTDLDRDMDSLQQLRQSINSEYQSFTHFTEGKSKIESGTEEWKK